MIHNRNNTEKSSAGIWTIPNLLSLFRLCLIPVIIRLYCVEEQYSLAGIVLILSGLTDAADGFIARRFGMISDVGKVLDPIADKLTQAAMLMCLVTRFPLMIWPFLLMLAKELFVGVTGFLVIRKTGVVPGANWHGKTATVLLYATMILHVFWPEITNTISIASIAACAVMIAVSFLFYGRCNVQTLQAVKQKTGPR